MRLPLLATLSSVLLSSVVAQNQVPVPNGVGSATASPVEKINFRNLQRKLSPKEDTEEEWLIYNTGGNKTCQGHCRLTDSAWNQAVPLLAALPQSAGSPKLRLGRVDCETDTNLCSGLGISCPSVWHYKLPQAVPGQETPKSPLYITYLSINETKPTDILSLPMASEGKALQGEYYEGALHAVDGWMAKANLLQPFGYFLAFMGSTPSWVLMITISFISRQYMSGKTPTNRPDIYGQSGAQPVAGAASTPSTPSTPATGTTTGAKSSGNKSSKKRR